MSLLEQEDARAAGAQGSEETPILTGSAQLSLARFGKAARTEAHRYWRGDWSKEFLVLFWFPLAAAAFISGGAASAYFFDGPFDWRYRTLSSLSSEVSNPAGYAYCCFGLMLAFVMVIPLCGYFRMRLEPTSPIFARVSSRALRVGFLGSIGVGIERLFSQSLALQVGKAHEYISLITFIGFALGLAGFCLCLIRWLTHERQWPSWALWGCFVVSAGPITGTGLSQAYLYFVPNDLGWVGPHWAELGIPVYLSLAFWEWLLSAAIFTYLYIILLCLPAKPSVR